MISRTCRWLTIGLLAVVIAGRSAAQQPPRPTAGAATEKENAYLDLRKSTNRVTQSFAERYFDRVKLQEWSSKTGTAKVMARYVAHDPDQKWVKLERVQGTGKDRSTRVVTVQVEQLNKTCQSRVRQIAALQLKLDELVAAEEESEDSNSMEGRGEFGGYGEERGAPMTDERGYEPAVTERGAGREEYGGYTEREQTAPEAAIPTAPTGADEPDPLGFGELANEPPLTPPASEDVAMAERGVPAGASEYSGYTPPADGVSEYSGYTPPAGSAPAGDAPAWAKSYDAFLANFTVTTNSRGDTIVEFGELADLQRWQV